MAALGSGWTYVGGIYGWSTIPFDFLASAMLTMTGI
jgi:hypothetical protein